MSNLFDKDWDLTEAAHILMEDIEENSTKETMDDAMINAAIKCEFSERELLDLSKESGLIGVYMLGMKHMYQYLKE